MTAWNELRAKDVMTSPVSVLHHASPLEEALRLLTDEGVSAVPVVDGKGAPVGVVSLSDVGAFLAGLERNLGKLGGFYFESWPMWDTISQGLSGNLDGEEDLLRTTRIEELMTREIIAVGPEARLDEVVDIMRTRRIHRVLVTEDGHIRGLVSTMDVMDALAGQAGQKRARRSEAA